MSHAICYRCEKPAKGRSIAFYKCNYLECPKHVHDSCVRDTEFFVENNQPVFYCEDHVASAVLPRKEFIESEVINEKEKNSESTPQSEQLNQNNINLKRGSGSNPDPTMANNNNQPPQQTGAYPKDTRRMPPRPFHNNDSSSDDGHRQKDRNSRPPNNGSKISVNNAAICRKCRQAINGAVIHCTLCKVCFHYDCLDNNTSKNLNEDDTMICVSCRNDFFYKQFPNFNATRRVTFNPNRNSEFLPRGNDASSPRPNNEGEYYNMQGNRGPTAPPNNDMNDNRRSSIPRRSQMNSTNYPEASFLMMDKLSNKVLPDCINTSTSWTSFFALYQESKGLYSNAENYKRVTDAIKCGEVKKLGGDNLYDFEMFEETLEEINDLLKDNSNVLAETYNKLKLHKMETNSFRLGEHLMELINFTRAAVRHRQLGYINTRQSINSLVYPLPKVIYTKCIKIIAAIRDREPSMEDLINLLKTEHAIIRTTHAMQGKLDEEIKDKKVFRTYNVAEETVQPTKFDGKYCWFHKNTFHPTNKCRNLWSKSGSDVLALAKQQKRCTVCGQEAHNYCPFKPKLKCNIQDCGNNHYSLYCPKRLGKSPSPRVHMNCEDPDIDSIVEDHFPDEMIEEEDVNDASDENYHTYVNNDINNNLAKMVSAPAVLGVITIDILGKPLSFLYDTGSTLSMMEESVADALKLEGVIKPLSFSGAADQLRVDSSSRVVKISVANKIKNKENIDVYFRTMKNLNIRPQRFIAKEFIQRYEYLKDLKLRDHFEIVGLIGIDNLSLFHPITTIVSKDNLPNDPIGYKTPLGDFILYVKKQLKTSYDELSNNQNQVFHLRDLSEEENIILKEMESSALNILAENKDANDRMNYSDFKALELLQDKVRRVPNSTHFEAPLLWREGEIKLPSAESKEVAVKRLKINEKVMIKEDSYDICTEQIHNLLRKGFASELTDSEIEKVSDKTNYIPIFFVKGKRLRMIWDGASKVKGLSLNDFLITGPNLYNELLKILLNSRVYDVLIIGDVEEMFHQTLLTKEDSDCVRFLFRFKDEERIREFRMNVLPFGLKCSPTIAQFVRNKIAEELEVEMPKMADTIKNFSYVDDIVRSLKSESEAVNLLLEMRYALEKGGFNFIKINSNKKDVISKFLQGCKDSDTIPKLVMTEKESRILGYIYNFEDDTMSLTCDDINIVPIEILSKRKFLSLIMSIYDPLGLAEFLKANLKAIYREFSSPKYHWDDILFTKLDVSEQTILKDNFERNVNRLQMIAKIKIPRSLCNKDYDSVELHAFGDAGKNMLCAVVYARFLKDDKIISVKLLQGKSFTVPLKGNRTIPELELEIAAKLVILVKEIKEKIPLKFDKVFFYTDSTCVYYKIHNNVKSTIYEKNRLEIIKSFSKPEDWRWIISEIMPADYGTKINFKLNLIYENEWYCPSILNDNKSEFAPTNNSYCCVLHVTDSVADDMTFDQFSNLTNSIRFFQYLLKWRDLVRFVAPLKKELELKINCKTRAQRAEIAIIKSEIDTQQERIKSLAYKYDEAEIRLLKYIQTQSFKEELEELSNGKVLSTKHYLYKWLPWIDHNGIMRINTRLSDNKENRQIFGYDRVFPIVLPPKHAVTKLYILNFHINNKHLFVNNVMALLKSRFFLQHAKSTIKSIIKRNCSHCIRYKAKPQFPLMGDLPVERLGIHTPAFSFVIIDLAGPIQVSVNHRSTANRYIFVYSCLTTRAIHLELIESLETNATLMALQICINLRGTPRTIVTDRGTNFVGTKNHLEKTLNSWNQILMSKDIIVRPIVWKLGPAKAPHMQGSVERMVGLVKETLKHSMLMIKDQIHNINDFTLRGILGEITGILNNRPIYIDETSENAFEIITPNNFLLMRNNYQETPPEVLLGKHKLKNNWDNVKKFTSTLWQKWSDFYLPTILSREKWINISEPLKLGDLVITVDNNVTDSWRLGRIVEIVEGSKGQVRRVTIKLGKNNAWSAKNLNTERQVDKYLSESHTTVTRPAVAVAKININILEPI